MVQVQGAVGVTLLGQNKCRTPGDPVAVRFVDNLLALDQSERFSVSA